MFCIWLPCSIINDNLHDYNHYVLQPCAENLYLCLYYEYRQIFTGVLAQLVDSMNSKFS